MCGILCLRAMLINEVRIGLTGIANPGSGRL